MQAENRVSHARARDIKSQGQNDIKIFIVEKNPADAAIAQEILESLDYPNTVIIETGEEAVDLFSTSPFGMVIVGVGLYDAREIESWCDHIRSLRTNKYIPVIAYVDFEQKIELESFANIFDEFLFKPKEFYTGISDFQHVIPYCASLKQKQINRKRIDPAFDLKK